MLKTPAGQRPPRPRPWPADFAAAKSYFPGFVTGLAGLPRILFLANCPRGIVKLLLMCVDGSASRIRNLISYLLMVLGPSVRNRRIDQGPPCAY